MTFPIPTFIRLHDGAPDVHLYEAALVVHALTCRAPRRCRVTVAVGDPGVAELPEHWDLCPGGRALLDGAEKSRAAAQL